MSRFEARADRRRYEVDLNFVLTSDRRGGRDRGGVAARFASRIFGRAARWSGGVRGDRAARGRAATELRKHRSG